MKPQYTLLGWDISYYTGKVRSYLRHKRISYTERSINMLEFMYLAPRKTGAAAMPIVITPDGEWVGDSSEIIDMLEYRFTANPMVPKTPLQRFITYLFELWGDEFWLPAAMHTRWSHSENFPRFQYEAGRSLLPFFPRLLQDRAAAKAASSMRSHLSAVGITSAQTPLLDRWIERTLNALETHFAQCPYILGGHPSLADFSLMGPLYGHLGTDPWSRRELVASRPHLLAYVERMHNPPSTYGNFYPDDEIPDTLIPLIEIMLKEMYPWVTSTLNETNAFVTAHPQKRKLPRGLGRIEFPLADGSFNRVALPYLLWMMQRFNKIIADFSPQERASVFAFLQPFNAECWLSLAVPPVERAGLTIRMKAS